MLPSLRIGNQSERQNALSIIHGFNNFLDRHTGDVDDNGDNITGHFIINEEGMLANNLHFEGGPQGYTPTQCATTEGQSLLILGYYYLYRATRNPLFLAKAERYMECFLKYFYGGVPIPNPPDVYRANWIMNAKNPFKVYGPANPLNGQSPGNYGTPIQFTNGVGLIPAGGTTNGELLMKVYRVFTGNYAYQSVRAGPASGGTLMPFDAYMAMNGAWDSDADETTMPDGTAVGTIFLTDRTFTGTLSVSYVIYSDITIPRNAPFDVWPTWRALTPDQYGNAIDAEQWFMEAALLMYQATGNETYNQVYQCSLLTCLSASVVDDVTYYFRQEVDTTDPCDYGISYYWSYTPTTSVTTIARDSNGYIVATKSAETSDSAGTFALEQIAVFNQIGPETSIAATMAIDSPTARLDFLTYIQPAVDASTGVQYRYSPPPGAIATPSPVTIPFSRMVSVTQSNGDDCIMFDGGNAATWGAATSQSVYETFTLNGLTYTDYIGVATVPDSSSGIAVGFWLLDSKAAALAPLTYKSLSGTMYLVVSDAAGYNYWYQLPQANDWTTLNLTWDLFTLMPNQAADAPATPTPDPALKQIEFQTSGSGSASIATYCWGEVPSFYVPQGEWSTKFFMHASDSAAFRWVVGDVVIQKQANAALNYTPGVVPFSNQYSPSLRRNEFWRGTPYTGYQYPVNWVYGDLPEYYANVIQFWYDAQQAYRNRIGVLGPFCPCYVWPRFDNIGEGAINSFDWGSDSPYPWAGYEARGFFSACHLWAELVRRGKPVDPKLVTVCQNWASYLLQFQQNNGGLTPSKFPRDAPAYNDGYSADPTQNNPDNVGHMTGLFLAGCIEMLNAGDTTGVPRKVARTLIRQLELTYVVVQGAAQHMSGSFSAWTGGNYFYGFWAGEIFRGLGLYLEWLNAGNTLLD